MAKRCCSLTSTVHEPALHVLRRAPLASISDHSACCAAQVSGTFRIVAKPLIEEIPVVAGMIVALKAPPEVSTPS